MCGETNPVTHTVPPSPWEATQVPRSRIKPHFLGFLGTHSEEIAFHTGSQVTRQSLAPCRLSAFAKDVVMDVPSSV